MVGSWPQLTEAIAGSVKRPVNEDGLLAAYYMPDWGCVSVTVATAHLITDSHHMHVAISSCCIV